MRKDSGFSHAQSLRAIVRPCMATLLFHKVAERLSPGLTMISLLLSLLPLSFLLAARIPLSLACSPHLHAFLVSSTSSALLHGDVGVRSKAVVGVSMILLALFFFPFRRAGPVIPGSAPYSNQLFEGSEIAVEEAINTAAYSEPAILCALSHNSSPTYIVVPSQELATDQPLEELAGNSSGYNHLELQPNLRQQISLATKHLDYSVHTTQEISRKSSDNANDSMNGSEYISPDQKPCNTLAKATADPCSNKLSIKEMPASNQKRLTRRKSDTLTTSTHAANNYSTFCRRTASCTYYYEYAREEACSTARLYTASSIDSLSKEEANKHFSEFTARRWARMRRESQADCKASRPSALHTRRLCAY